MVDAMGIARLLDSQQPDNTHGIYRTMFPPSPFGQDGGQAGTD
jgi:hypothetical protein